MIAPAKPHRMSNRTPAWHAEFVRMMPAIARQARISFRHLDPDAKAEAIQDVICNACTAFVRLAELGKLDLAYPSVLARFAVAQVRDGRKVGCKLNVHDVLSPYCRRRKNVVVERLDHFDDEENQWAEAVVRIPARPLCPTSSPSAAISATGLVHSLVETAALPRRSPWATGPARSPPGSEFPRAASANSDGSLAKSWRNFVGEASLPGAALPRRLILSLGLASPCSPLGRAVQGATFFSPGNRMAVPLAVATGDCRSRQRRSPRPPNRRSRSSLSTVGWSCWAARAARSRRSTAEASTAGAPSAPPLTTGRKRTASIAM